MRLVHYQFKPEFAASVGIENTSDTGNNLINNRFKCLSPSPYFFIHCSTCYHLNKALGHFACHPGVSIALVPFINSRRYFSIDFFFIAE